MRNVRLLFVLMLMVLAPLQSFASDLARLQQQGRVSVTASVDKAKNIALHQQVTLTIEVATDTWFTKGTKIHYFDVDNALIANRSAFAVNTTERRHGKTYAIQQWEVVLYPLATGELVVPSITVHLQVKGDGSDVAGYLVTRPLKIRVNKPSALMNPDNPWMVSPSVKLNQHWSTVSLSIESFSVGDALERTVSLEVQDNSIMLLPELVSKSLGEYQQYVQTIEKKDQANRGEYIALLTQQVTYVFDQPGQFVLPSIEVYQWNPATQSMELRRLQGETVTIKHTFKSFVRTYWLHLGSALAVLCLALISAYHLRRKYNQAKQQQTLPLFWLFVLALHERDDIRLENLICRKLLKKRCYELSTGNNDARYQNLVGRLTRRYSEAYSVTDRLLRREWLVIWILVNRA